jgi:hypothetical protein
MFTYRRHPTASDVAQQVVFGRGVLCFETAAPTDPPQYI